VAAASRGAFAVAAAHVVESLGHGVAAAAAGRALGALL
jgi:hypothetical protein